MFSSKTDLIFLSVESRESAKGNPYKIVTVADPATYERYEFFADKGLVINVKPQETCVVDLKARKQGFSTVFNCLSVMAI
jgi:hypothetical protein